MKPNKMQYVLLAVLILGLGGLTVVYASLTQKLEISSTASVVGNTWDIHFANGTTPVKVGAAEITTAPKLDNTKITELAVSLSKPGDTVTYTFDIVNAGTIDAIIDEYVINTITNGIVCTDHAGVTDSADAQLVCNNLVFTLTYAENTSTAQTLNEIAIGTPVAKDQVLKAGQDVSVMLTIGFNQAATAVPANDVSITGLDVDIDYLQN